MSGNQDNPKCIGVLTSGGDAPGMNSAVRAVVRTGLRMGAKVFAIKEGYDGLVHHGEKGRVSIEEADWHYVAGIMNQGGTKIGTSRCEAFKEIGGEAKLKAAKNLIKTRIDRLVIIGGDGSLTGAKAFRTEWPDLLTELVKRKDITPQEKERFSQLAIVGLVGSIDNDMCGTDMTIGADTALHRISEAVDAISSTAASHQRIFVVKVMGRHCGYLAVMGALITGADWVIIPEDPPAGKDWKKEMINRLQEGREPKRSIIVILAEGVKDCSENNRNDKKSPCERNEIGSTEVARVLKEGLKIPGEKAADVRVTILGHVQRGGAPSAYDRILSSRLGDLAVKRILRNDAFKKAYILAVKGVNIVPLPLEKTIDENRKISDAIDCCDPKNAMAGRGDVFRKAYDAARILMKTEPMVKKLPLAEKSPCFAVMHSGAPAPGINAAVRAAVRFSIDKGFRVVGVKRGFEGLVNGHFQKLDWHDVNGWASRGGAELETSRKLPEDTDFAGIETHLEKENIKGLLIIGGWSGYVAAWRLYTDYKHFNIPIICMPAAINNNLPGTDVCIGSDTALNNIVDALDKIKQSAVAVRRCFVVEVMGRYCGYLALMSGLASGAERVYLPEEPLTLEDLSRDLDWLIKEFSQNKRRLALMIRNEMAYGSYDTAFMTALFNEEGKREEHFDVRQAILGHLQQGGNPSPFDRILAVRMAAGCIHFLVEKAQKKEASHAFIGVRGGRITTPPTPMGDFPRMIDENNDLQRARDPWWMNLRNLADSLTYEPG